MKLHQINRNIVRGRTCPTAMNVRLKSPEATRCPLPPSLQEHHAPAPNKKNFPLPPLALVVLHFASQPLQRAVWSISCIAVCMLLRMLSLTAHICKQVSVRPAQAQAEARPLICIRPITPTHFFQLPPVTGLSTNIQSTTFQHHVTGKRHTL